jgi:homopolymeric O-antigen transport system ATP-binding protein
MRAMIEARGISKRYELGGPRARYGSLRESLSEWARTPFRKGNGSEKRTLWALKDVSFAVVPGKVVGVIGRNGAGKSTLLKVLSRVTEPTEGEARLFGRVASLLEVGTGFHPELTGRENIFLNGAILGMHRSETIRKFDEIVAFAEVERFLDTPVKHYSSGMYVRLAFAVAAHLDPEILVIDEVLAVGDAKFQEKCLGKIENAARAGRTVLFVSHNMGAVRTLCDEVMLLEQGRIASIGPTSDIVRQYLTGRVDAMAQERDLKSAARTAGNGAVRITSASVRSTSDQPANEFAIWEPFVISLTAEGPSDPVTASFWVLVYSMQGEVVLSAFQYDAAEAIQISKQGATARVTIDPVGLAPGRYSVSIGAFGRQNEFYDWVDSAVDFEVTEEFRTGRPFDQRFGTFSLPYKWEVSVPGGHR